MESLSQLGSLLQVGAVGAICAYLLLRTSQQLTDIGKKVDRLARTQLLLILSDTDDPQTKRQIKAQATEMLAAPGTEE